MNFFSSSTSRLIIPRWKRSDTQVLQQETLSNTKYASTEGRFSIIDKRYKESASMESSDSSSDDELNFKDKKTIFGETKYDHHISYRSSAATSTSSQQQPQSGLKKSKQISGSRFRTDLISFDFKISCNEDQKFGCLGSVENCGHVNKRRKEEINVYLGQIIHKTHWTEIVPLESCYERGRWACWDFYNTEPPKPPRERHNSPLPLFSSSINSLPAKSCRNICKSSLFSPIDDVPHTAPANDQKSITFSFDFSDESDIDSRLTIEAVCF
ncbi:unnamed protein product [Onchocerca ochengi]|uniref:Uncharacterized protein n=1 Tax=Onchocerca ochengi TaxID=42157 RepID=A0A182E1B9_ONCOC|nr:unnamed protein product [Onchocerca ochengi]